MLAVVHAYMHLLYLSTMEWNGMFMPVDAPCTIFFPSTLLPLTCIFHISSMLDMC